MGQLVVAVSLIVLASAACSGPAPIPDAPADGIRLVRAQVRGITWAACAATMDVALRRRLEGVVDIRISQEQQTAEVALNGTARFSPDAFRAAVGEADVTVIRFEIEACGRFERGQEGAWFVAGANRFAIPTDAAGETLDRCLAARLDDTLEPDRLDALRSLGPGDP